MIEILNGIFTVESEKHGSNNNPIYIIGDIHGDYQCIIHCLVDLIQCCEIIKIYDDKEFNTINREYISWKKNNKSVLVFCGDLIHRKRFQDHILDDECSDVFILKTLLRLKEESKYNNGDILLIAGNHEIMNILRPDDDTYISPKNINKNKEYFNNKIFIKEFIENSYAWIKINDILIAHGGLCSDYLKYLEKVDQHNKELKGNEIINFINNKYKDFFSNFDSNNYKKDDISYDLFITYDLLNKSKHNIFWCREWGYNPINCEKFNEILQVVDCTKMIISHCPQFLSPDKPKMINFECLNSNNKYNLARVDLGMSRCFEYNKEDEFMYFLSNNYNRKISVLKLQMDKNELFFSEKGIITSKLSCLQYLLLKYGITKESWESKNIYSNWIGFNFLSELLDKIKKENFKNCKEINKQNYNINDSDNVLICLLYPVYMKKLKLLSINQFDTLSKNN